MSTGFRNDTERFDGGVFQHVLLILEEHGFQTYKDLLNCLIARKFSTATAALATEVTDDGKVLRALPGEWPEKTASPIPAEFGRSDFVV